MLSSAFAMRQALAVLCLVPFAVDAYELRRDSTGEVVRWGKVAEFVVDPQLGAQMNEQAAQAAMESATASLAQSTPGLGVQMRIGTTDGLGFNVGSKTNQNDVILLKDWIFDETAIAVTVVTVDIDKHEILDADIAFNIAHRKFKVVQPQETNQPGIEHDDIQNTMTHEMGHALGLAHNPQNPDVVMYPSARRGEIKKRNIHADDAAGLAFLYPAGYLSEQEEDTSRPSAGCSTSASGPVFWEWCLLLALALKRRGSACVKATCALLFLAPLGAAVAAPLHRAEVPAADAGIVATAEVVSASVVKERKLLFTDLELNVRECLKGTCGRVLKVRVPGGRWKNIEQFVEGMPVPQLRELVGVALPSPTSQTLKTPRVYVLSDARDFAAFAQGTFNAGLKFAGSATDTRAPPTGLQRR